MRLRTSFLLGLASLFVLIDPAFAQHHAPPPADLQNNLALNVIEIVTGVAATLMALQAALAFKSGRLGKGMKWVTVGMLVMSIGHIILVLRRIATFDVLGFLGSDGSFIGFSLAVFISFTGSAYGFWLIRRQSRHYGALEAAATARSTANRTARPSS